MPRSLLLLVLLLSACGEGHKGIAAPNAQSLGQPATSDAAAGGLSVGASCTERDGYVQPDPCATLPPGDGGPTNCISPGTPPPASTHELPPGVGYCLTSDSFPHGYFTMNCAADQDCPGGAVCSGKMCWMPCTSDLQCEAPLVCPPRPANPTATYVRTCICLSCVHPNDPP